GVSVSARERSSEGTARSRAKVVAVATQPIHEDELTSDDVLTVAPSAPHDEPSPLDLRTLKEKSIADLPAPPRERNIDGAPPLRRPELMFAILQAQADRNGLVSGDGVLEILQDGFGFLRSPDANYLPGPDDIYVSPSQIRRFNLRTGDVVSGQIRAPKDGE